MCLNYMFRTEASLASLRKFWVFELFVAPIQFLPTNEQVYFATCDIQFDDIAVINWCEWTSYRRLW